MIKPSRVTWMESFGSGTHFKTKNGHQRVKRYRAPCRFLHGYWKGAKMNKSQIFYTEKYKTIEEAIVTLLNSQPDFLSTRTATSTRAVGDAIQTILSEQFQSLLGDLCAEYSAEFARRAMADLAFTDKDGLYYIVDVKTHRLETHFSMPNLTSVERLARFYEDDKNYFVVLIVKYAIEGMKARVKQAHFIPIEFLSWDCLTIGALGWGQIQITNANVINVNESYSRKKWMLELCDVMLEFYPKEIEKIKDRIDYFRRVKQYWESKSVS
jgi:hypothetical protein